MNNSKKGFAIPIIISVTILLIIGGVAYFYVNNSPNSVLELEEEAILNNKIKSILPDDTSKERIDLLLQIDDFTKESINGKSFSTKIYSLIKTRLDQVLKEIPETQVSKGKVKIWYIYNMGIIAKSSDKTIAFDLAGTYVYPNMSDFTKYIDILFITHFHNDHFDKNVVQEALKNNVTIVIPDEKVRLEGDQLIKDDKGEDIMDYLSGHGSINFGSLFVAIKPQEKTTIKGIDIIAYPSNHIGPREDNSVVPYPIDWYYVNLSGLKILHMGDGTSFNYQPDFVNQNIDVFITHNMDPMTNDSLVKLVPNAKTILPLHILELGHGPNIINSHTMDYQNAPDDYSNGYYKTLQGKTRFIPMIWGESLTF